MRFRWFLFLSLCISLHSVGAISPAANKPATVTPERLINPAKLVSQFASLKMKEVEKLMGRKLTIKEKIGVKIYQWKFKKEARKKKAGSQSGKGQAAMILGIVGLALLFVPFLNIAAIPCMILAIVFGYQAKKANPDDRQAKTGIILGWIGVGIVVLATLLLIAIFAGLTVG
jgi:hypothetical protein